MIFVTLGSQKFQFNRLLIKIDSLIEEGVICENVFAQTGASDYVPKHFDFVPFMDQEEFDHHEAQASLMITHGGSGAILSAVKKGIKVIAAPRLARFGEHVDDHQLQLLQQFDRMGVIETCYDVDNLGESYRRVRSEAFTPYESHTNNVIESIRVYLGAR